MKRTLGIVVAFSLALSACSLPPEEDSSDGEEISVSGVPEGLAGSLVSVSYNASAGTLTLHLTGLDGPDEELTYARTPGLDVSGYQAYTYQQNPLNRHFTAIAAESGDGSVLAVAVTDGGQFNENFGGGYYARDGLYYTPTGAGGQVTYAGSYAGVSNLDSPGGNLLDPSPVTDPAVLPAQSARVSGSILLNANFADNLINGVIYDRVMDISAGPLDLPDLALLSAAISEDGTFYGDAQFRFGDQGPAGNYGGIFGGADAGSVAGLIHLDDIDEGAFDWDADEEFGLFVLVQCGMVDDDPICDTLD